MRLIKIVWVLGTGGFGNGKAYIFEKIALNWQETQILEPTETFIGFSRGVAMSDDHLVIGAPFGIQSSYLEGVVKFYALQTNGLWTESSEQTGDTKAGDEFGIAISVSGRRAVIGARKDDEKGIDAGAAYIFEYNDNRWQQVKKLVADDGEAGDSFGHSVSLDGNRVVVGAHLDDHFDQDVSINIPNAGSIYIFEFIDGVWQQTSKIREQVATSNAGDQFGHSVSLDGGRIVVGAPLDNENGTRSGAFFVYDAIILRGQGSSWSLTKKVTNPNTSDDEFGYSVSLQDNRALIGAFRDDDIGTDAGAAYIYESRFVPLLGTSDWVLADKLISAQQSGGDFMGTAVSLDGNRALVGAMLTDSTFNEEARGIVTQDTGAAYIFSRVDANTWTEETVLLANDRGSNDQFGYAVSLSGNKAVVSAWRDDTSDPNTDGSDSGSAYLFELASGQWAVKEKFTANIAGLAESTEDFFGVAIDISDQFLMIGAHRYDFELNANEADAGTVYFSDIDLIFKDGLD